MTALLIVPIYSFITYPNYIEITKPNMERIGYKKALTDKKYYKDHIVYHFNNKKINAPLMINIWTHKFAYVYKDIVLVENEDIDLYMVE